MWAATPRTPPRGVVKIASLMLRDSGQQEVSASVPCTHMLLAICRATVDGHDVWAAVPARTSRRVASLPAMKMGRSRWTASSVVRRALYAPAPGREDRRPHAQRQRTTRSIGCCASHVHRAGPYRRRPWRWAEQQPTARITCRRAPHLCAHTSFLPDIC